MTQHMSCTSESFTGVYLNFNIKDKLSAKCKAIEKQTCHTNMGWTITDTLYTLKQDAVLVGWSFAQQWISISPVYTC